MARPTILGEVEEKVLVLCRRRCCLCYGLSRDLNIKRGQIAHLDGDPTNNTPDNLSFLCMDHHDEYDARTSQSKGLTLREVKRFRKELHGIIDSAWKEPVAVASVKVRAPGDVSGHYVREGKNMSAELDVELLPGGRVHVAGLALWGIVTSMGPHTGQLDFEAPLEGSKVVFRRCTQAGKEYKLDITFEENNAIATEQQAAPYFGMNVSFEGDYRRV